MVTIVSTTKDLSPHGVRSDPHHQLPCTYIHTQQRKYLDFLLVCHVALNEESLAMRKGRVEFILKFDTSLHCKKKATCFNRMIICVLAFEHTYLSPVHTDNFMADFSANKLAENCVILTCQYLLNLAEKSAKMSDVRI